MGNLLGHTNDHNLGQIDPQVQQQLTANLPGHGLPPGTTEPIKIDTNSGSSDGNSDNAVPDPVLPAECPGGCPPSATCQNGECLVDGEPADPYKMAITNTDASTSTPADKATVAGPSIIKKITTTIKNTDRKVLYAAGGGLTLLTIIAIAQN